MQYFRFLLLSVVCTVIWGWSITTAEADDNRLRDLRHYLVEIAGFSDSDLQDLRSGPVARELKVKDKSRGLALVGAVRVNASAQAFLAAARQPEHLFGGEGILQFGTFSSPPVLADVAALRFHQKDLQMLSQCKVAECKFKLGKTGIELVSRLDWSSPDAGERFTALARQEIVDYLNTYQAEGNTVLIEYADKSMPFKLADGFRQLLGEARYFHKIAPELAEYLLAFPDKRPAGAEDAFYWSVTDTGYHPTTVIGHLVVYQKPQVPDAPIYLVVKQIYASHYFGARLSAAVFIEESSNPQLTGNYLLVVDRVLFDDKLGLLKRRLVSDRLLKRVTERLEGIRDRIEQISHQAAALRQ